MVQKEAFGTAFVKVRAGLLEEWVDGKFEFELFDGEGGKVFGEGGFGGTMCLQTKLAAK